MFGVGVSGQNQATTTRPRGKRVASTTVAPFPGLFLVGLLGVRQLHHLYTEQVQAEGGPDRAEIEGVGHIPLQKYPLRHVTGHHTMCFATRTLAELAAAMCDFKAK